MILSIILWTLAFFGWWNLSNLLLRLYYKEPPYTKHLLTILLGMLATWELL